MLKIARQKNSCHGGIGLTKVLIIDDDRSVRHIVASGLNGYCDIVVVPAADGYIGLDLLESEKPTVVLLDVFLPHHRAEV